MKFSIVIFFIPVNLEVLMTMMVLGNGIRYEAISDNTISFVFDLYRRELNSEPPTPSLDPAVENPSIRLQICEEISRSGVFRTYRKKSVEMKDVYHELQQPQYLNIFHQMYNSAELGDRSSLAYEYDNPYILLNMQIRRTSSPDRELIPENEYVFMCLLRKDNAGVLHRGESSSSADSDGRSVGGEVSPMDVAEAAGPQFSDPENIPTDSSNSGDESAGADDSVIETATENPNTEGAVDMENTRPDMPVMPTVLNVNELQNFLATISATDTEGVDVRFGNDDMYDMSDFDTGVEVDEDSDPDGIVPFYVTKIYNAHRGLKAHRFVLTLQNNHNIMLAERAARVSSRPDFNVELHYLELRKRHEPSVFSYNDDPVCRLKNNSQLSRLCTVVLTSPFFKGKVTYPFGSEGRSWFRYRKVSFKTQEGLAEAAGRTFFEFVIRCHATKVGGDGDIQIFYISRAYHPNEVFVYTSGDSNDNSGKIYLENLSTHVGIVHERYNFGEVEI